MKYIVFGLDQETKAAVEILGITSEKPVSSGAYEIIPRPVNCAAHIMQGKEREMLALVYTRRLNEPDVILPEDQWSLGNIAWYEIP